LNICLLLPVHIGTTSRAMTVAEAFCAHHQCPVSEFQDRVFRQCLHSNAVLFGGLLLILKPKYFREDLLVIQQVGLAQNLEEVDAALSDFHYVNHSRPHWLRTGLKIRISVRKLRMMAVSLLDTDELGGGANSPLAAHSQSPPAR
jgi:hypothetical protein